MADYAGESLQKKLARGIAYRIAHDAMAGVPWQSALCLAGPEAHDVGPLAFIGYGPEKADWVGFVDADATGLEVAGRRLPGCFTHHGPLDTLAFDPGVHVQLAVLDFCGHMEGGNYRGAVHVAGHMADGGVMLITTLRGREHRTASARAVRYVKQSRAIRRAAETDRWESVAAATARATTIATAIAGPLRFGIAIPELGREWRASPRGCVTMLGHVAYDGPVSPMLITILRLGRRPFPRASGPFAGGGFHVRRNEAAAKRSMLSAADEVGVRDAALLFDVQESTLIAWKAHRTMGTYAKENA